MASRLANGYVFLSLLKEPCYSALQGLVVDKSKVFLNPSLPTHVVQSG